MCPTRGQKQCDRWFLMGQQCECLGQWAEDQIQQEEPEDTYSGETLIQKSLPCSFEQVKDSRCSPACCKVLSPQILMMEGCSLGAPQFTAALGITRSIPLKTMASTCCLFAGNRSHDHQIIISSASLRTPLQELDLRTVIRPHMAAVQMGALQLQALWGEVVPSTPVTKAGSCE